MIQLRIQLHPQAILLYSSYLNKSNVIFYPYQLYIFNNKTKRNLTAYPMIKIFFKLKSS